MRKALTTVMLAGAAVVGSATSAFAAPNPPSAPKAPEVPKSGSYSSEYEAAASSEKKSIANLANPISPAFDLLTLNGEERQSMAMSGDTRASSK